MTEPQQKKRKVATPFDMTVSPTKGDHCNITVHTDDGVFVADDVVMDSTAQGELLEWLMARTVRGRKVIAENKEGEILSNRTWCIYRPKPMPEARKIAQLDGME